MSNAAFVLMNLDLVAVPLQIGGAGLVTVYCGPQRAEQLLSTTNGDADTDQCGRTAARNDAGSRSIVGTRPPVAREIASHRSAGA